jgi:uncharacterized damage-inducible protein DinB
MHLTQACCHILTQLTNMVNQLSTTDFVKPVESLGNSTIGQHLRHTVEFFICLQQGSEKGIINYDKRLHDKLIETDKPIAVDTLKKISDYIRSQPGDQALTLEVGYDLTQEKFITIATTLRRELVYNIEHAVHHMAIMKIGIREAAPYVTLPADFGVAASTIRYQETSAVH